MFVANPSTTVPPSSGEVAYAFFFTDSTMFAFTVVLPTVKGASAYRLQLAAKGQVLKAPCNSEDDTPRLSTNALQTSPP